MASQSQQPRLLLKFGRRLLAALSAVSALYPQIYSHAFYAQNSNIKTQTLVSGAGLVEQKSDQRTDCFAEGKVFISWFEKPHYYIKFLYDVCMCVFKDGVTSPQKEGNASLHFAQ